jgi:hypothetical protein
MNQTSDRAPNLTQRPPRSPRVRLGGYVVLPRILDKGRAEIAGTAGEFKYNNPADYHWFRFTGITPEALKAELATDKGDGEMRRLPLRIGRPIDRRWCAAWRSWGNSGCVRRLSNSQESGQQSTQQRHLRGDT